MKVMTDEKFIEIAKDHVQDWYLNHGIKISKSKIYILSYKSNILREYFVAELNAFPKIDFFKFSINTVKNKSRFIRKDYDGK